MAIGKWLTDLIGGGASKIIDSVTNGVDKFVTTDAEKQELALLKGNLELEFKKLSMEAEMALFQDRDSARKMYMQDSSLQKSFALTFLVFYCLISLAMIAMIISMAFFDAKVDLPQWGVVILTSVFTGMSVKVNTIVDFLFGGSKAKDDSDKRAADAFEKANP